MLNKIPANKLQWLAVILLALYPLAIMAARLDITHFRNSFLIFIVSALIGFIVLVLSIFKLSKGQDSESKALLISIVLTAIPLGLLGSNIIKARTLPFIHDITTDIQNPPQFVAAVTDRTSDDHPVDYEGDAVAQLQVAGYPNLTTLELNQPVESVLAQAQNVVKDLGWVVLASNTTQSPFTLEAVDESFLFGFKDDIVIRMEAFTTPEQNVDVPAKTRVDVRSMSRVGKSDLGANAARIESFLEALQNRF
jgi:uncharacterized protein (DUF1499 family)